MEKLNNKGMTLTELIVSFALVSVAVIYFYQTVSTVSELYYTAKNDTQEFADRTYVEKLISTKYEIIGKAGDAAKTELNVFCQKVYNNNCTVASVKTNGLFDKITYKLNRNGKNSTYIIYKYNKNSAINLTFDVKGKTEYEAGDEYKGINKAGGDITVTAKSSTGNIINATCDDSKLTGGHFRAAATYTIPCSANDNGTNLTDNIKITVKDTKKPTFACTNIANETIYLGDNYKAPSCKVSDESSTKTITCSNSDGIKVNDGNASPLTCSTENNVKNDKAGNYTITYNAEDRNGNESSKTKTVTVKDSILYYGNSRDRGLGKTRINWDNVTLGNGNSTVLNDTSHFRNEDRFINLSKDICKDAGGNVTGNDYHLQASCHSNYSYIIYQLPDDLSLYNYMKVTYTVWNDYADVQPEWKEGVTNMQSKIKINISRNKVVTCNSCTYEINYEGNQSSGRRTATQKINISGISGSNNYLLFRLEHGTNIMFCTANFNINTIEFTTK